MQQNFFYSKDKIIYAILGWFTQDDKISLTMSCHFDQSEVNNRLQVLKVLQCAALEYQLIWQFLKPWFNTMIYTLCLQFRYLSCNSEKTVQKQRRRQSSGRPGSCPSPPPRETAAPTNNNNNKKGVSGHTQSNDKKEGPDVSLWYLV